jgi:hypothetical protein
MAGVPINFPSTGEGALANYNYTDLAEGTGIVIFYASATNSSTGTTYTLNKNALYPPSLTATTTANYTYCELLGGTGSAFSNTGTINFDTSIFNLPQTLRGTLTANIPFNLYENSGGSTANKVFLELNIKKIAADTTETQIAMASSAIFTGSSNADKWFNFPVTLPTTIIKKGEKLRANVKVWATYAGGGGTLSAVNIFYDPLNRAITETDPDQSAGNTQAKFYVPFRIDL